eukprot:3433138-Alexandrium_andersonii.AAC.1
MRGGAVLEAHAGDRPSHRSASASASSSRAPKRVQAWGFQPEAPMRQVGPEAPQAKARAAPSSPGIYAAEGGAYVGGSTVDH